MTLAISMLKSIWLLHINCERLTLASSMLKNIFPLHTKIQDYDLKYPNVVL